MHKFWGEGSGKCHDVYTFLQVTIAKKEMKQILQNVKMY